MTEHQLLNPPALGKPKGYSNGVLAAPGRLLFVAGQVGWDDQEHLVSEAFVPQFEKALENVLAVVVAAGGRPSDIVRMTIFVGNKSHYTAETQAVGAVYRKLMGRHYPAMSLVEVAALLEPFADVEIEATAVIPDHRNE